MDDDDDDVLTFDVSNELSTFISEIIKDIVVKELLISEED